MDLLYRCRPFTVRRPVRASYIDNISFRGKTDHPCFLQIQPTWTAIILLVCGCKGGGKLIHVCALQRYNICCSLTYRILRITRHLAYKVHFLGSPEHPVGQIVVQLFAGARTRVKGENEDEGWTSTHEFQSAGA